MENSNLYSRYAELKTKVAGNIERKDYNFTDGAYDSKKVLETPMTSINRRILTELNFAIELSTHLGGKFNSEADAALSLLENAMEQEDVLSRSVCMKAEELLLPLSEEAKKYTVIYAGHAHIDMNWMWGWQETVAITISTLRTVLNLMKEYSEFTFSQSQASVYKIVEQYAPDMMDEIKQRISEGRWEVTANAWVETDKNMPDTESLIRHIQLTKKYLKKVWGINSDELKVDFSPDTFGHSAFIPEINTFGNVPYYYHCRALKEAKTHTLYRYRAPSGNEILMYKEPYWYNSGVDYENGLGVFKLEERCEGLKTAIIVYGVGNHGGGPTRRDIENMLEMQKWPIYPTLKFGTLHEFFKAAEEVREKLPVVEHEINTIFTGCNTTQSRIKLGNRRAETGLLEAESINALTHFKLGTSVPAKSFENAWQNVLFTHFHDILTGSCVQESREYAMGKYAEAIAYAQSVQSKTFETLALNVDTSMFETDCDIATYSSEGAGVGYGIANYAGVPNPDRGVGKVRIYTVFNPTPTERTETVELTLWDYVGNVNRLEVVGADGTPIPYQLLDGEPVNYWSHFYNRILARVTVPAMGYAVCCVRPKQIERYGSSLQLWETCEAPTGDFCLENEHLCALFTPSGMLYSLVDKASGNELLSGTAGLWYSETQQTNMSSWRIGRYLSDTPITECISAEQKVSGPCRSSIVTKYKIKDSVATLTISLDANSKALTYDMKIDWKETSTDESSVPLLTFRLPLKEKAKNILRDVPAGFIAHETGALDLPALTGACAESDSITAALITDCKYGYRLNGNVLSVSLINSACNPDPYPERGIHAIKLFIALTDGKAKSFKATAKSLITPLLAVPTARHEGSLGSFGSLLGFDSESTLLSSVSVSEDGALTLRFYEAEGKEDTVTVTPPFAPTKAFVTDMKNPLPINAEIKDGRVSLAIPKNRLLQLKIYA